MDLCFQLHRSLLGCDAHFDKDYQLFAVTGAALDSLDTRHVSATESEDQQIDNINYRRFSADPSQHPLWSNVSLKKPFTGRRRFTFDSCRSKSTKILTKNLKLLSRRIAGVCEHFKQHTCDVLHRSTRRTRRTSNINGLHLKTAPTTLICNYFPAIKYLSSWNEPGQAWLAVILCFAIALFPWPHCFKLTSCREEHLFYFNPAKIELANVEKVNYKHRYRLADSILTSTTDPG